MIDYFHYRTFVQHFNSVNCGYTGKLLTTSSVASITELINELPSEINHLQRDIFNPVWQILKEQGHDESSNWKCLPLKRTGLKTQELPKYFVCRFHHIKCFQLC